MSQKLNFHYEKKKKQCHNGSKRKGKCANCTWCLKFSLEKRFGVGLKCDYFWIAVKIYYLWGFVYEILIFATVALRAVSYWCRGEQTTACASWITRNKSNFIFLEMVPNFLVGRISAICTNANTFSLFCFYRKSSGSLSGCYFIFIHEFYTFCFNQQNN